MNSVLERLLAEREKQTAYFDQLMADLEERGSELTDPERANVQATQTRIAALDNQIEPLVAFESSRAMSATVASGIAALNVRPGGEAPSRRAAVQVAEAAPQYRSVGAWLVDYVRSRDPRAAADERADATGRLSRVVANQTTGDLTGVLPVPIVGPVLDTLDASRPFMASFGIKPMPPGSGNKFSRPKITQHTQAGKQAGEKTELVSRKMIITPVEFIKSTIGGTVDVSRQSIDWTSPAAWDILVTDLANQYAIESEEDAATVFSAGVTQAAGTPATDDLTGWVTALYDAAGLVYAGCGRLPTAIWASIDMWQKLGALVDSNKALVLPPNTSGVVGTSSLATFQGSILELPRIVVPAFPAQTLIVGNRIGFECYEERIGLLSAVEPALLGVEVAYGGYVSSGFMEPLAFATIPPPPVVPLTTSKGTKDDK